MDKAARAGAATAYWSREVSWTWRRMVLRAPDSGLIMQMRFSHPHVRNRLERLMGSNVTRLTDRDFMQRLAERIQEEHVAQMQKRIRAREEAEVEREKKLILEGKIPVEQVPRELAEHPVFKISRITSEAIENRRSKVQHPTMRLSYIPEGTLQALAKAMAPDEEEDEEDKERAQAMPKTPEESEELLESEEEEEEVEEEEAEAVEVEREVEVEKLSPEEEKRELKESLKKEIEERVEKEGERRALKGVLKTGFDRQEDRSDMKKKIEKKVETHMDGGEEGQEGKGEREDGEGEEEGDAGKEEPEPVADDYDDDDDDDDDDQMGDYRGMGIAGDVAGAKRIAVHRHSQLQKEHRRKRLVTKGGVPTYSEDGRPLSPDEVERERANLARTSVMTAARNEWQAEVELAEQMARERDKNYLLSEAELRRLRYEAPLIEELRKQETVADLYRLADEIVGGLWIKPKPGK